MSNESESNTYVRCEAFIATPLVTLFILVFKFSLRVINSKANVDVVPCSLKHPAVDANENFGTHTAAAIAKVFEDNFNARSHLCSKLCMHAHAFAVVGH